MMTAYRTLVTLRVTHAYSGGVTSLVEPVVPAEMAEVMRRGRMISKMQGGALHVLYEADATGAARAALANERLRIGLRVVDPSFANVTDPASLPATGVAYWRNATSPTALDAPIGIEMVGSVFEHALADAARPVTVTVEDAARVILRSEVVTAAQGRSVVSLDLGGVAPGAVTVSETYDAGAPQVTTYLLHPELARESIVGVVELDSAATFYTTPAAFEITLAARTETLRYYLVASGHTAADVASLRVVDAGFTEEARPEIAFDRVEPASFGTSELPVSQLGGAAGSAFVLYRSRALVARLERARKKIQLERNGDVLVAHLAQPRREQADANIIVHIGK